MKKFLAILTALLLVASVAYSLDSMKDTDMDDVTGQAGISITQYLSAMTITQAMEGLSWGDDDGGPTALGGTGAGHLAIRAATATGAQDDMGATISIPSTGAIQMDVDATGIYLSLPGLNITVNSAPRMQFSVAGGVVDTFPGVLQGSSSYVLGDLATDNLQITVATPSTMRIAPH